MYLSHLYPSVREISETESVRFTFGANVTMKVPYTFPREWTERMRELWNRFCCTASVLTVSDSSKMKQITIGEPACAPKPTFAGGYAICADAKGVCVAAESNAALYDGFKTLVQLICPDVLTQGKEQFYITGVQIQDGGAIPFRSLHICVFPETEYYTLEKTVRLAGMLKCTHVVLEFWGTLRYECLPALAWKESEYVFTKAEIRPLVRLANSLGMEVIPMTNHLGHASGSRHGMGRHTVLNQNPRLARLFEPDGWTWCASCEETWKLLSEMRKELCELCGHGSYFHIGMDEAYSFATCDRCRSRVPYELLAEYVNRLTEDLCSHGRRPILWHDQFLRRSAFAESKPKYMPVATGDAHGTDKALALLDKRVILADWEYSYAENFNLTTKPFMDMGFDTVLCPWDSLENIRSLCANAKEYGAYGIMLTTWHHLPAYLPKLLGAADDMWDVSDKFHNAPSTEAATILRTVAPTPDYKAAGWKKDEVDE